MKNIPTFEQFLNEKTYRLSGYYSAKGLIGKIMQAFKKEIQGLKHEGDVMGTLEEVNKEWDKFKKDAHKMILDQVKKAVGSMDGVVFVTADLSKWSMDEVNGLNDLGGEFSSSLYIALLDGDVVINVGFADDVDAGKYKRKFDKESYQNSAIATEDDVIYGTISDVGDNNLELRAGEVMQIDAK